jgi:hypothetical protein
MYKNNLTYKYHLSDNRQVKKELARNAENRNVLFITLIVTITRRATNTASATAPIIAVIFATHQASPKNSNLTNKGGKLPPHHHLPRRLLLI